ncbi:Lacal_2735 family protein [Flavobacteriaceae bacterium]|jgi:hypothetical protein|nr:Lacal_2735 family protein [Flavobacteriaceae bacterium]
MIPKEKKQTNIKHLELRYKKLVEKAYNFKYTNSTISDFSAYQAMRLLEKINRIKFGY